MVTGVAMSQRVLVSGIDFFRRSGETFKLKENRRNEAFQCHDLLLKIENVPAENNDTFQALQALFSFKRWARE
jgi:hypothetical protein